MKLSGNPECIILSYKTFKGDGVECWKCENLITEPCYSVWRGHRNMWWCDSLFWKKVKRVLLIGRHAVYGKLLQLRLFVIGVIENWRQPLWAEWILAAEFSDLKSDCLTMSADSQCFCHAVDAVNWNSYFTSVVSSVSLLAKVMDQSVSILLLKHGG